MADGMTPNPMHECPNTDLSEYDYYMQESRAHLHAGRLTMALGCYILAHDLAGLKVDDQTRRDYLARLQQERK